MTNYTSYSGASFNPCPNGRTISLPNSHLHLQLLLVWFMSVGWMLSINEHIWSLIEGETFDSNPACDRASHKVTALGTHKLHLHNQFITTMVNQIVGHECVEPPTFSIDSVIHLVTVSSIFLFSTFELTYYSFWSGNSNPRFIMTARLRRIPSTPKNHLSRWRLFLMFITYAIWNEFAQHPSHCLL